MTSRSEHGDRDEWAQRQAMIASKTTAVKGYSPAVARESLRKLAYERFVDGAALEAFAVARLAEGSLEPSPVASVAKIVGGPRAWALEVLS